MKGLYTVIIAVLMTSCFQEKKQQTKKEAVITTLESFFHEIDTGALVLNVDSSDYSYITISNLDSFATGKEYNRFLGAYSLFLVKKAIDTIDITKVKLRLKHNYKNLFYDVAIPNADFEKIAFSDFKNEENCKASEILLRKVNDEELAYFDLVLDELRKNFLELNFKGDLIDLILLYVKSERIQKLTEDKFTMYLFYYVSQYPYGNLTFNREILVEIMDVCGDSMYTVIDKAKIAEMYFELYGVKYPFQ